MNTLFGSLTDSSAILANKRGELTPTQRDLLHLTSGLTFWYALGSAVVIVGIVAFALAKQAASFPPNAPSVPAYFWIVLGVAIGLPLAYLGWQVVRSSRVTRELASGAIPSEEGRIEWTGWRYRVVASTSGLRSIYGPLNAMPGRYRCYLLPGSRYLLSAAPLETPHEYHDALTDVLGRVHGFSRDDVAVNREGRISPAQKARLRWNAIRTGLLAVVFLAVLVGGFVLASIARSAWYAVATIGWAVILALVLPTMVGYGIKWLREGNDTIATVQGTGGRGFTYPVFGRSTVKYYIINGTRFDVGSRAYDALVEGEPYRVYYTQFTKTIVSIEAVQFSQ